MMFKQFNMTIYMVEINEWGCRLYGGVGNLLTFVSFCDKNMWVWAICGASYSLENTIVYERALIKCQK